jgi:radical SAM superfamily enzyme YgiQ (UPF0313 family)/anti-anti-sigma regulatory factor
MLFWQRAERGKNLKIRLIEPKYRDNWTEQNAEDIRSFWFPRLSLPTIAALTPEDVEVRITDENVMSIDYDEDPDLVGLTAMTMHAPKAYSIADRFRVKGIPVVMGGIHASMMPQEAKEHADAVVIGEAEEIWPKLVDDFRNGKMKPIYRSPSSPSLQGLPRARTDLLKKEAYDKVTCVQTTRGCPFNCDYCSVSQFFGHRLRCRPVAEVVEEVRSLEETFVVFVDDNIVGDPSYAKDLFKELIPLKIRWGSQASITIAKDPELLRLASESGCYSLFVGIESLSTDNLRSMNKRINKVEDYEEAIKRIRDSGIMVIGSFIFGMDHDDPGVFERTVRFCEKNRIEVPVFFVLTPVPGTRLFQRLKADDRILTEDWSKYDGATVVMKPRLLSVETLQNGFNWACRETYSWSSIAKRVIFHPKKRVVPHLIMNRAMRRMTKRFPEGVLSPFSKVLSKLGESIPVKEFKELIPTIPETSINWGRDLIEGAYKNLHIRVVADESIRTLFLFLEGAMDASSADVLIKKVEKILLQTQEKIVIDFGKIDLLSPRAVNLFFVQIHDQLNRLKERIRIVNLTQKASGMMENLDQFLKGIIITDEELEGMMGLDRSNLNPQKS